MEIVDTMFFNRELSWLRFNTRVLNEARNTQIPLLDRLKFLAIYGTNLDEFYMIRVAGLKKLYASGISEIGADKLTTIQQLSSIREYLHNEKQEVQNLFRTIKAGFDKEGLHIKSFEELNKTQKSSLRAYFLQYLFLLLLFQLLPVIFF